MFRKMPLILSMIILLIVLCEGYIPLSFKEVIYALSLSIKSVIIFALPILIFMLLFKTMVQLASKATKMIVLLLAGVCVSNFISTMISYNIGSAIYQMNLSLAVPSDVVGLASAWSFNLPKLIANDHAMFSGVILGILGSLFLPGMAYQISKRFESIIDYLLRLILVAVPVFISGFIIKLLHDKVLENILYDYAWIFALVALAQFSYIALIYSVSCNFQFSRFVDCLKNMLPAAVTSFGSMSSAATMPLTIIGTEKNTKNPSLTRLVIPSTVNIHLIGDCFAIPIFAFAVMKNFGVPEPSLMAYITFAFYFVIAKFSVAAVPGGGILVMLPILEAHLGFHAEMASLITALYILFDPVITCANVCGNGAFALALNKMQNAFKPVVQLEKSSSIPVGRN